MVLLLFRFGFFLVVSLVSVWFGLFVRSVIVPFDCGFQLIFEWLSFSFGWVLVLSQLCGSLDILWL